ncbi:MAG: porin [Hydrogenophaga sp.]|uniref:porin n=1 Tax=Hydrogenophaga sp. TaxID=1904254 RepID=UPI002634B1C5|nr:porin [Hydrogenophaga sp.]MCW5669810.1 porin [Hydrogenophaga sp.]
MKKSLIALAVLGSVAGVAQAQSSVTMYGLVDVWAGRTKNEAGGVSTSTTVLNSGGLATSRWGVQGSEDLGGGLKAIFKLEQGFNASTGTANTGTAFDRQSWVGLEGGFGTAQFGNVWSAFDDVFYIGNSIFDAVAFSPAYQVMSVAQYNDKPRNALRYTTPNFGGFSAAVSRGLDENAAVKRDQTDFNLQYAAGPLTAAFAYQLQNDAAGVGNDAKFTYFTAAYDLGVAVVKGGVGQTRNVLATKTNDWQIGADFPLSSALTLSTGYAASKDKDGTDTKRAGYSVGALYALSKRTSTYAAFTKAKEKVGGTTTETDTIFGVGVQHKF